MFLLGGQQTGLLLTLLVTDTKTGRLIRKIGPKPAKSFLVGHMKHMECALGNVSVAATIDNGGASRNLRTPAASTTVFYTANAAAALATSGIQAGTGTTAVVPTNTALVTLIAEGAGAGQMNYGACTIGVTAAGASECTLDVTRSIANNSGGTITVQEIGLSVRSEDTVPAERQFLVIRDLTGAVAVSAGQTLTVVYTYRTVL